MLSDRDNFLELERVPTSRRGRGVLEFLAEAYSKFLKFE
jgi:hypothetical protein